MAKVVVKLTEMTSAEPTFVSLVKRGANRIPFRIVKSQGEDDMGSIDLTSFKRHVFKRETEKKAEKPTVIAFVVEKSDNKDGIEKALTDAGYSVEKSEELEDGTVAYRQTDDALDAGSVVRVSDNTVAIIKGMDEDALKGFTVPGVEGYTAGADLASFALKAAVIAALGTDDVCQNIQKAVADYGKYVNGLAVNVPANVFKADAAIGASLQAYATAKAEADRVEAEKAEAAARLEEVEKAKKKKPVEGSAAEEAAESAAQEAAEDAAKKAEAAVDEKITKALEASNATLLASLTDLVTKAVQPVADSVAALDKQIKDVATKAEAAEKVVKGIVVAGAPEGDRPSGEAVRKKEDNDPRRGCFDTAMIRKTSRYNQ